MPRPEGLPPRWPRFAPAAVELGFLAVDIVPTHLREEVVGSLNLFRTPVGALTAEAETLARCFANMATISLFQARPGAATQVVAERSPEVSGLTRISKPHPRW